MTVGSVCATPRCSCFCMAAAFELAKHWRSIAGTRPEGTPSSSPARATNKGSCRSCRWSPRRSPRIWPPARTACATIDPLFVGAHGKRLNAGVVQRQMRQGPGAAIAPRYGDAARATAQLRDPPSRRGRRSEDNSGTARSRVAVDHPTVHPRRRGASRRRPPQRPPQGETVTSDPSGISVSPSTEGVVADVWSGTALDARTRPDAAPRDQAPRSDQPRQTRDPTRTMCSPPRRGREPLPSDQGADSSAAEPEQRMDRHGGALPVRIRGGNGARGERRGIELHESTVEERQRHQHSILQATWRNR